VVTGRDGIAVLELPIGKAVVVVGRQEQEAWIGLDQETHVKFEC
jgi:hypothetical protein